MKTQELKTSKGEFVAVELPGGAINPVVSMGYLTYKEYNESNGYPISMSADPVATQAWLDKHDPSKDYKVKAVKFVCENAILVGRLPELDDGLKWDIVGAGRSGEYFRDYENDGYEYATAKESFDSLLKANGVVFVNPLGAKPKRINGGIGGISKQQDEENKKQIEAWHDAQDKVWSREQTYLFKKICSD